MIGVTKTRLPFLNKYVKYLKKIWNTSQVTNKGEFSQKLEKGLEKYLGVKNLLVVANGTLALQLSYKALGLRGEVITTPFTFPATTNSLIWEGLKPVFADIDRDTFNIEPEDVEKKITKATSAILAVHVFGNPCDLEKLEKIAKKYKVKLIYDSAHAFGVKYKGKSVLKWGDVNILSFHAAKVFHTAEGGAVIAKNKSLYKTLDLLRNHGIETYDKVNLPGINAKMSELHAALGLCVLEDFDKEVSQRKKIYEEYRKTFSGNSKFRLQRLSSNLTRYNCPYFPICFSNEKTRNKVHDALLKKGIRARKYFYPPIHELPYLKSKSYRLPNATNISHTVLCLPLYGDLLKKDVKRIINIVNREVGKP